MAATKAFKHASASVCSAASYSVSAVGSLFSSLSRAARQQHLSGV